MTYKELFNQLDKRAQVKKIEIKEKESKEEFNALEFFKPKGIKKRIKSAFSEMTRSLLVTENPDKDILEYLCHCTPDGMNGTDLFKRLFEEARRKDDDFLFAYGFINERYSDTIPFKSMLNHWLVSKFKEVFGHLTEYLMLTNNFNTDLSKYLVDNFRWIVPIVKKNGETGPRNYILPHSNLNGI